ncbi:T9SS type A sorting domain-containing protein [Polaribacter butkevichii]|uniref:Secretion system C-terminal sorting domain-containing protein n=1 Tax=Polaribacter butkevichii TaxID=218490 RepID=A0A2P6C9Z6_9FLAO|nr:T9SS type A sorting domain-containing protein [Polaribacter butkevichii]PQJ71743.1 hypothetical protein BTO14_00085 [Polaribacter butkevichii]
MKKLLHIVYFTLLLFVCAQLNAQTINYKKEALKENSNFYEIVKKTRQQFINKKLHSKSVETILDKKEKKLFERWVWIWKDRINPDGTFPQKQVNKEEYLNLLENNTKTQARSSSTTKPWTQIGPTAIVNKNGNFDYPGPGRVDVVVVDPGNSDIMYIGTTSGGLWKTTDAGATWTPKTDHLAGLGVTDILLDPNNTDILYMATGDRDSSYISSIGLFKSTDAGETWAPTGLTFSLSQNEYIRDISFGRTPAGAIVSTTIFALTNEEIKRSTDSAANWSNIPVSYTFSPFQEKFQSMVFDPNDGNKIVVSDYYGGIYYSTNGGNSFKLHDVYQGGNNQKILRITATPADNDHFYGINQDGTFQKYRFAFTEDAADLIKSTDVTADINGTPTPFNSQDGYIQCIAISPTNANNLMVGGVQGWKSTDNGDNFTPILNAYSNPLPSGQIHVHADHHFLLFTDDSHIINGNDAGLRMGSFSPTSDEDFPDISSGLIITQIYNIAITHGLNGDDYMMANQDNDGFSKVWKDGKQQWVAAVAGDGTGTAIDIVDPTIRYLGGTSGQLNRTNNGYANGYDSAIKILRSDAANAEFISPLALHPTNANIVYVGHGDVKKSTDKGGSVDLEYNAGVSDTFTALNSGLTQTSFLDVSLNNSVIRIFAIGNISDESTLRRSIDDGVNWTTIASPAGVKINSVYAVPNTNVVYATASSYSAGNKVYKSTNNGDTWTNISGDMDNIIMKKIILDPNKNNETIYVATELGLYYTDNSTTSWKKLGTGLPNVIVTDIKVSKNNGNVYIGTFGRGMWVYDDQKYFDNTTPENVYWSDVTSWEGKTLPTTTDDVFIKAGEEVTLDFNGAVAKSVEIADNGFLYIEKNADLTIENNFDSNSANSGVNIYSDATDSGTLIVKGNSTGNITYVRGGLLASKWSLVTPPVAGQAIKDFAEKVDNDIRKNTNTGTDPNRFAIAKYNDANATGEKWEYFDVNVATDVEFEKGAGYSISRNTDGEVNFTGTIQTSSLNVNATHDKWVAVGNPFTAYYPANKGTSGDFVTENTSKLASDAPSVYVWDNNQGKYVSYSDESIEAKVLAPGQGFFIKMKASGTDEMVAFNNQYIGTKSSLTGNSVFNKSSETKPYVKLFISNGQLKVNTDIIFSKEATIGFDAGKDIINFNSSEFDLTTKLLDNSSNKDYTLQSIPSDDYENQVIPLNLKGKANEKITFSALNSNLPDGMKIFLEDKETGNTYELSETKNYTLTLASDTSGFGRFYAHFSTKVLSVATSDVTKIEIYNTNNLLQINGTTGHLKIDLFDINGKRIFNQNQTSNKFSPVDLNGFSRGVYLVKVTSEGKSVSKKIIIN